MITDITSFPYFAFAPSNIALVKYWGKSSESSQWPANDSLSMTFNHIGTMTGAKVVASMDHEVKWQNKAVNRESQPKIFNFCDLLVKTFQRPNGKLSIATHNNFPSDAGIASSASGFAALTLAAAAALLEVNTLAECEAKGWTLTRLAALARLGSGSACRSLHGGYVHWQRGASAERQSVAPIATSLQLASFVLIVDEGKKSVSSRDAHRLAPTSPLFTTRVAGIPEKLQRITQALHDGSISGFGPEMEQEALEMHCVAMTSQPNIHYLKPQSWQIMEALRHFRSETQIPAYATIDAGPNIHVLTTMDHRSAVLAWCRRQPARDVLQDETGKGAVLFPSRDYLEMRFFREKAT